MAANFKRFALCSFLVLIMLSANFVKPISTAEASTVRRGAWISFIDMQDEGLKDLSEAAYRDKINGMFDELIRNNLNTVYFHVRAFSDAFYPSPNFAWSEYITSNPAGPGYDPLKIAIEIAHSKGLRFEAWMNPYRISWTTARTNYVKSTAPSVMLPKMIQYTSGGQTCLVWNPADQEVRNLIAGEAAYVARSYDVDGIHFDDYFYDPLYYGSTTAVQRRMYVNSLIRDVYSRIKSIDSSIEFGISPAGNVENCLDDGADVATWLSSPGYIDYLVPQIYWSDSYGSAGTTTMFTNRLDSFLSLNKNNTDIYVGLALYKVAGKPSVSTDPGWTTSSQNLKTQVLTADSKGAKGYVLFSSMYLSYDSTRQELANLYQIGNTYRVTYSGNGSSSGTAPCDNSAYNELAQVRILENSGALARTGYVFSGWNTKADGSGATYKPGDLFTMGTSDVSLFAKWTPVNLNVVAGTDRFATAAEISKASYATADTVVIATAWNFPDALAAGPVACLENAPILLTGTNSMPEATISEIRRLGASRAIIMGSQYAVGTEVEAALKNLGLSVERVSGTSRFGTAVKAAQRVVQKSSASGRAVLVYGWNFPDALSIGSYAAREGIPVLLTDKNTLTPETKAALAELGIVDVKIAGSTSVVSANVEDELEAMGITVSRYSGSNRFATAAEVAAKLFPDSQKAVVACGWNFPDALAAVPFAAKLNAPVIIVNQSSVPDEVTSYLAGSSIGKATVVGGEPSVGAPVKEELIRLIQ